jgi:rod shape determining protein RodA
MAMVMGMLPVVGIPLPLISYGGTALLTLLIGQGLIFSIAIHHNIRIGRNP